MSKKFQRNIEDFVCENCGISIEGDGYTNHCSKCLWSKHVDVNPGDREAECGGMMKPMSVEVKNGKYSIRHECLKCGLVKVNKVSKRDDFEEVLNIAQIPITI